MLFNLNLVKNTILSYVIINLYFLILVVIAQIFNPIGQLVIPIGIPIKEAKAEIEIHLVIIEIKTRKC